MDYTVHASVQVRILEWVAFPQGIFSTQESNPGLLPCKWILYQLSHKGSPFNQAFSPNYKFIGNRRLEEQIKWQHESIENDPGHEIC